MTKVCFFSVFSRNDQSPAYKQARALADAGFDVSMVFADGLGDEIRDGIFISSIPTQYSLAGYKDRLLKYQQLFWEKLSSIDADVYETSDVDSLATCLKLKQSGKIVIFRLLEEHPYTLYSKLKFPRWVNRLIVALVATWMKYVLRRVDKVYTVAPDIQDYLTRWKVQNVEILGNYPEVQDNHQISLEDYLGRDNRIIYFGAIYSISRQEVFFDALNQCPEVSYLLAGDFGVGNYRQLLENHSYWKKVEFINTFPKDELPSLIGRCTISNVLRDFSVTGYPKGSYGIIKLFESMEAGLPIICSDVPVYRELMKEYKCGILVDPNDSNQIKDAIRYLTINKKEAYQMGQNGRKAIIERYNWERETNRYISCINSLTN